MASEEATVAASENTESLWINYITELLQSLFGQVTTVLDIVFTNGAQQGVQRVLAVADATSEVHDQQAVALQEECLTPRQEHVIG